MPEQLDIFALPERPRDWLALYREYLESCRLAGRVAENVNAWCDAEGL